MRWRWVLGAAALAGVAVAGTAIVRERRRIAHLDPEEIRERLHSRLPAAHDEGSHATSAAGGTSRSVDDDLSALEATLRSRRWRAADDATREIVLGAAGSPAGLSAESIASLDPTLLDRLDRLWAEHSARRFGVAAQLGIMDDAPDISWITIGSRLGWIDDRLGWLRHGEFEADIHPLGRFPWTPGWLAGDVAVEPRDALDRLYAELRAATERGARFSG